MITGKSLRRMDWRFRRLLRRNNRYCWHGEDYESCIYTKNVGARLKLPEIETEDRSQEKPATDHIPSR